MNNKKNLYRIQGQVFHDFNEKLRFFFIKKIFVAYINLFYTESTRVKTPF